MTSLPEKAGPPADGGPPTWALVALAISSVALLLWAGTNPL